MDTKYSKVEIEKAQKYIDTYTHTARVWHTEEGKKALRIANQLKLESANTNHARARVAAIARAMERDGWER